MKKLLMAILPLLAISHTYAQVYTDPNTNNVGVGTTSPSYKLDIAGTVRATGNITAPTINGIYIGGGPLSNSFAVGGNVLSGANSTGYGNIAVGANVLSGGGLSGYQNIAIGSSVLTSNTSGFANMVLGANALGANTTGHSNVAIGVFALNNNVTGYGSIGIGTGALGASTNGENISIGYYSGSSVVTGIGNTFLGFYATTHVTGSNNTILGSSISYNELGITSGSGNTIVGGNITGLSPTLTNHIILGDGQGHQRLIIDDNGNAGIGTLMPDSKLTVGGTVHATEVLVDQTVVQPDYVFDKDYDLASLKDVKTYIDQNHHLPEIPSAAQVAKEGINLGEMNAKLLKKIEELTLYLIQQKEELLIEQTRNQARETLLNKQQKQLYKINKRLHIN